VECWHSFGDAFGKHPSSEPAGKRRKAEKEHGLIYDVMRHFYSNKSSRRRGACKFRLVFQLCRSGEAFLKAFVNENNAKEKSTSLEGRTYPEKRVETTT
jgi:hypothetical protein